MVSVEPGRVEARLELRDELMAPNEFMHAGTVVTLADSCCGMGCLATLPEDVAGFTTLELKTNFLRTAQPSDTLRCVAAVEHAGRSTQIWGAVVERERDGKPVALFRCTQDVLPADDPRTTAQDRQRRGE